MRVVSIRQWILFVIFLLVLLFLVFSIRFDYYANIGVTDTLIERIENKLYALQAEAENSLEKGFNTQEKPNFDEIWPQTMSDQGVFLYVIDYKSTLYWSESLPISFDELQALNYTAQYVNIGNGWYIAQAYKFGSQKALTLILIQSDYTYQNKYIENSFNTTFKFPSNAIISPLGTDVGIPVKGKDGNPIFVINTDVNMDTIPTEVLTLRWLALILVLLFICVFFYKRSLRSQLVAFSILLAIRIVLFYSDITNIYLFSPMLFADSSLLPSLGDLLLHAVFSFIFLFLFYSSNSPILKKYKKVYSNILLIYTFSFAFFMDYIVDSLAINSNISFKIYQISSVSIYSFVSYFILSLFFSQLLILVRMLKKSIRPFPIYLIYIHFAVFILIAFSVSTYPVVIILLYIFVFVVSGRKINSNYLAMVACAFSLYLSYLLIENNEKRDNLLARNLGQSLFAERDPVAEMLLHELEVYMKGDPFIADKLRMEDQSLEEFSIGLTDRYFRGYFHRYDFHYEIVKKRAQLDDKIKIDLEKEQFGVPIAENSHFYFMNKHSGKICYLGEFIYPNILSDTICLYINLESKAEIESKGYPDLLIDEKNTTTKELEDYSYAKYSNGKLVAHYGEFDYSIEIDIHKLPDNYFFIANKHRHYYHFTDQNNLVIVSRPQITLSEAISMFSYSFVLVFVLLSILLAYIARFDFDLKRLTYQWRISAVILGGITIALTLMTVAVLYYTMQQSEERNIESIHEKMRSVLIDMEQNFFYNIDELPEDSRKLRAVLVNLSNIYNTDFNFYSTTGELLASSREEIFNKKLQGKLMNREAFHAMSIEHAPKFTHTENIGNLKFYSAYAIYYNKHEEVIAYINLPYFFKQSVFREELMYLMGTIFNIYIIMIIIGVSVSMFVSGQITRPLNEVRLKMGRLDLSGQSESINYKRDDELGDLIREYNRMIIELRDSAQKLAYTERESAWREMARQIAHEIKNPLTPMKLGLQHALRMKKAGKEGWEAKMDEIAHSVLEQIEVLTQTASEFSSFARINKEQFTKVNVDECILSGINLFKNYENTSIELETDKVPKYILASEEQFKRVITNLIKNGIEASSNAEKPKIVIKVSEKEGKYFIRIKDNGEGIRKELHDSLFRPNFTTKSSGTGLGLAISQSIMETFGGKIMFIPEEDGACFELIIPMQV